MDNLKIEKVSVALSPIERKIIERKSRKHGLNNFSSALRMIVREWDEVKRGNGHTSTALSASAKPAPVEDKWQAIHDAARRADEQDKENEQCT